MKYIFIYISTIFLKFVNCFRPYIEKYIPRKSHDIVKSLSGLLQNIPYMKPYINNQFADNKLLCNSDKECDANLKKCNELTIIPGYIDHDPKAEALLRFKRK